MITYNVNKITKAIGEKMQIHIKSAGESLKDISEKYGVSEENIRMTNELYEGEGADGEELLILIPTRSYTVQYGDTADRLALRFGISKNDIYSQNPWLIDKELKPGQSISLKCGQKTGGMAVANGYFYNGCTREMLKMVMPYLTYITFADAVADERGIHLSADHKKEVEMAISQRKIPLVRVYDRYLERYKNGEGLTTFAEGLISMAESVGYKGIVLDSCSFSDSAKEFSAFLMILRKLMIGCDLILITEINEKSPIEFSEYADGSVMYYPKYAMDNPPSFDDGERKVLADFACLGESAKTFIDLPSLARRGKEFTTISEAQNRARRCRYNIEHNENTLLSHIRDRRQGEYSFSSLKSIRAMLELISEFDYMGICFDIMRTPLSHILMYNAMFKTHYFNSVRTREGCSRADGE